MSDIRVQSIFLDEEFIYENNAEAKTQWKRDLDKQKDRSKFHTTKSMDKNIEKRQSKEDQETHRRVNSGGGVTPNKTKVDADLNKRLKESALMDMIEII